jgi:MRG-binding protein
MSVEDMDDAEFLSTVDGEIAFFRAIMRARPVGIHRHFHILNIRNGIHKDTNRAVSVQAVWDKLRGLYDMDALEAIVSSSCRQDVS